MNRAIQVSAAPLGHIYAQVLFGAIIWLTVISLMQPGWAPALLLFGPLVLFPMLFEIERNGAIALRSLALAGFLPAVASYAFEQGIYAGALALPWLAFTLVLLGYRLSANLRTKQYAWIVMKCYLVVGACWLVLARSGIRPLNFEHVIVHATAVHFHYAGFVLPILALQLTRQQSSRTGTFMLGGLLLGMPLVALGITLSQFGRPSVHWFDCAAVWFFSGACVWFAMDQIRFAFTVQQTFTRGLLLCSSLSLIAAMSLALLYATGNFLQTDRLGIPFMLRWHGPIQVFGFALPGVVAWNLVKK